MKVIRQRAVYIITQNGYHTPYVFTKSTQAANFIEDTLKRLYPENKYNLSQAGLYKYTDLQP